MSYQQEIGVSFTFNTTLDITLSSADIIIPNLATGTAAESNLLGINVRSNNITGFTLNATVGNATDYDTRDLVHQTSSTAKFENLNYGQLIYNPADFPDSVWGYSVGPYTSWIIHSPYTGLPLYSDTENVATLLEASSPASINEGTTLYFRIAAKAAPTQVAGEYNNVINFAVVAKPVPMTLAMAYEDAGVSKLNGYYKMQDMTAEICNAVEVTDDHLQVIDSRDQKVYWIAKLRDGKCWMTQNLDLDIDENTTYTAADTDLGRNWLNADVDTTATWTPMRSTIKAITDNNTTLSIITDFADDDNTPYSVDPGNWYWSGVYYNSSTECPVNSDYVPACDYMGKTSPNYSTYFAVTPFAANGTHGHIGNYYNWTAAIASNDSSSYTSNTHSDTLQNPINSICPRGWRLPLANVGITEFAALNNSYNGGATTTDAGVLASPLYFVRGGYVWAKQLRSAGYAGGYWTSTVRAQDRAYRLRFASFTFGSSYISDRHQSMAVRCVARTNTN